MNKRKTHRLRWILGGIALGLGALIAFGTAWYKQRFTTGFQELLFTLSSPLTGAAENETAVTLEHTLMPVIAVLSLYLLAWALLHRTDAGQRILESPRRVKRLRAAQALICAGALAASLVYADAELGIIGYYRHRMDSTRIYEERYVDPGRAALKAPEKKKNLIYLYLESMETSYADQASGGIQPGVNYIPRLTTLAQEHLSFSDGERLGGWKSVLGTNWTSGALLATTSGLPFELPVNPAAMAGFPRFMPGVTALGDILARDGYTQEFLCGSDGQYAGRSVYFREHGDYEIFDLFTARERGYIPEDYFVWWGFEDQHLFRIARDEITRLAEGGQPFNFTFLTVDPHHPTGYVCDACEDEFELPLGNVLRCQDRQVADFVAWCMVQPFWEDTVLIITGDHTRMDPNLVEDVERLDRSVYNCFMNIAPEAARTRNRSFTAMDMLPTTLSALGYQIPGDRLGLGTDLFSSTPTLAEEMGVEAFEAEINRYSAYYLEQFAKEK